MSVDVALLQVPAVLSAIAEPTRWRILQLLRHEELCVCHLVEELGLPQPLVSHHLRVLREVDVVATERFRYWTYYRLDREVLGGAASELTGLLGGRRAGARRRPCG